MNGASETSMQGLTKEVVHGRIHDQTRKDATDEYHYHKSHTQHNQSGRVSADL